jgi:hypothetical protein
VRGGAHAGQVAEFGRRGALQLDQAADPVKKILRHLNRAPSARADAQQDGQQLSVVERLRSECDQSFARSVLRGQIANAVGLMLVAHSPPFV